MGADSQDGRLVVVRQADRHGSPPGRFFQCRDRERVRSARGDADHHVVGADIGVLDARDAVLDGILRILDRFQKRAYAAGHQEHDLVVRPVEGRRQLRPVLHADASGRARADINETPAVPEFFDRSIRGCGNRGKRGSHRGHGRQLPLEKRAQNLGIRPGIQVLVAQAKVFSRHGSLLLGWGNIGPVAGAVQRSMPDCLNEPSARRRSIE